jgi:LAO/AO transport system kinase
MMETINEQLKNHFYQHPEIATLLEQNKKAVEENRLSPFTAAMQLLAKYFK